MKKKIEKLLDDEIFGDLNLEHMISGEPVGDIQQEDVHPLYDHYDPEINRKLAKKLFKL